MLSNHKTLLNRAGLFSFLLEGAGWGLFFVKMTSAELTVYTCVSVSFQNVFVRRTINDWIFSVILDCFLPLPPLFF